MTNLDKEFSYLQEIGKKAGYGKGMNYFAVKYSGEIFKRYIHKETKILELGPAEGIMTDILAELSNDYTIVEAAKCFCDNIKVKHQHIKVHNSLFEEFESNEKYNVIILGHVLEHVENPVEILKLTKQWLTEDGVILSAVPNANSIHRKAAVLMNILKKEDELGETDYLVGHRRVYNPKSFKNDFLEAGLKIEKLGGYWLKPLTNKQIEENWTIDMINAFMVLGEQIPEIAGEIYIVAKK
jgi:2-polyprenyl-3-methyl-5-hydroxy-6-metoxy-1,4-benzoquinol methylase